MASGMQLLRLNDDMLIEILKKINGLELEHMKQTCKRIQKLAYENSKAICIGTQRGLPITLYVDRWQKDKIRIQQYRNYLPEYQVDDHVMRMKALPISRFYLNFDEAEGNDRLVELVEILEEAQPICGYLDMKGIPAEFITQITSTVDCQNEITVHQNPADAQQLINTLKSLPYAQKFNIMLGNNNHGGARTTIPELFEQIKCFHSFEGPCSNENLKDFIFDLYQATDYGNLKKVILSADFNRNSNIFEGADMPKFETVWDGSLVTNDRHRNRNTCPKFIRKMETAQKYVVIKEAEYGSTDIYILEKKLSEVVDTLMKILKITDLDEDLRDEFYIAEEERQRQIMLQAFLATLVRNENDEDN